jgi:hypothetical protein
MKLGIRIVAFVGLALGILWILQGLNLVGGSFMTGQKQWILIGSIVALACAGALLWTTRRPG